jgi:hypothetical protein
VMSLLRLKAAVGSLNTTDVDDVNALLTGARVGN